MPKLVHRLPSYRKHKASGQAIVTFHGRDHYLGPHGAKASKREYDRLVAEYLSSGRSQSFGTPEQSLTVVELAADYRRFAEKYYGAGKNSEYRRIILLIKPLRELYGRIPAVEFGPVQLKAMQRLFIDRGWGRTYINASCKRITRMFRWAAGEGKIPAEVARALAMVPSLRAGKCDARETEPIGPVSDEMVEATLPHLPAVVADMVRLQRRTGMRPAEVCIVRPCDVDRSTSDWVYRPASHKTQHHGKERAVPLGPIAQGIVLKYLARDPEACCFRPCDSEAKRRAEASAARRTPLSCGNRPGSNRRRRPKKQPGDCYDVCAYRRAIARACDKAYPHPTLAFKPIAELTVADKAQLLRWRKEHRWAPNQLRHAAATEVRRQFGLEAAQVVLGHSQANVTQVYAERDLARGVEVARAIG
jgi:integrase